MIDRFILRISCLWWSFFDRSNFYRDLADGFLRKVGIRDFLELQASNARMLNDPSAERVYRAMSARLSTGLGGSFADLLLGICPRSDQLLLKAVDDAGADKVKALELTADAVDFQSKTLRTIAVELAVPVVALACAGYMCVITADIIAMIARDAPAEVWSGFNGFIRWLAESISSYATVILIGIFIGIVALVLALSRWTGPMRLRFENIPPFGLYRDYNAALVLSSMAMMIRSGKTMRESLEAMRVPARPWLRWHLSRIITSIEDNPSDYIAAFGKGLMPGSVRARLASLLASKSFADAMVSLGSSEITSLGAKVQLSARLTNWVSTGALVSVAVLLSLGQMTISSALSREADPSKVMQRQMNRR